ncbi:MAG TPA: sulfotransferase [Candidatus Babeliales bacterium]|nr:sulfotransferase [Candidatus Babeliales bacterium]
MSSPKGAASRAIAVIGMHRSGTSAVARGLQALGVYLGNDFLDAQPENPTGYWEDRCIVELNERVLKALDLRWDDVRPIDRREFAGWQMWRLRRRTMRYLRGRFARRPLWGFKDPRTMRLLPFWRKILHDCKVDDAYLLVIRHPASIAASLYARQQTDLQTAQQLWLEYTVPFLHEIAGKPLIVVDYDLLMRDPPGQLQRIARRLELPAPESSTEVERFAEDFLDEKLRHTIFSPEQVDAGTDAGSLTHDAFLALYELASDRKALNAEFWRQWEDIVLRLRSLQSG